MERRIIFFLERQNPERYQILSEITDITAETLQPPRTQLGISIAKAELERCQELGLPILRRCLIGQQAQTVASPVSTMPDDQFIALLCLKAGVDRRLLHHCTLEQALALCENWDTVPA